MRLTVRKDIAPERRGAVARATTLVSAARARIIETTPGEAEVLRRKRAEATRYLALYPQLRDQPANLTPFPFIAAEVGVTKPNAHALANFWLADDGKDADLAQVEGIARRAARLLAQADSPRALRTILGNLEAALAELD